MNEELLTEVSLSVPAILEPIQIPIAPVSAPKFLVNPTVPISHSSGIVLEPGLREMQERVSALCKPYPEASILPISGVPIGFNFGQNGEANVPPVFNMGSTKLVQRERHMHFQKGTKSDVDTNPKPKGKPSWYCSELVEG